MTTGEKDSVLKNGGLERLLKDGGKHLTDDERALLLTIIELDADKLNDEERAALDNLKKRVKTYDTEELERAVDHMLNAKAKNSRKLDWPDLRRLKRVLRKWRS